MVTNVLFLCTQNSARSIIAESVLNQLGGPNFRAFSAGSRPRGTVHPMAIEVLRDAGHDVGGLRSKSWEEFARPDAPSADIIITICESAAAETCPVWPGHPVTVHWGMADPAHVERDETERRQAFAETLSLLTERISALLSLPVAELRADELRRRLNAIGKVAGAETPGAARW